MTSLYALADTFRNMLDGAFDPETGEALPEFEAQRALIGNKIGQVAAYILNTELDAAAAKTAVERIKALQAAQERKAQHLRDYLANNMLATGITESSNDYQRRQTNHARWGWLKGMKMTKTEFKKRWESNDNGGGITFDDIANCYTAWGLGGTPRTKPLERVRYVVLKAAGTNDAEEFDPAIEESADDPR